MLYANRGPVTVTGQSELTHLAAHLPGQPIIVIHLPGEPIKIHPPGLAPAWITDHFYPPAWTEDRDTGESTSMVWPTLGSRTAKEQNRTAWTANQSSPTWSRTCPDSPSEGLLGPGAGGYTLQASSPSRSVTVTPLGSFLAIKPCPRHTALAGSSSDVATTLLSTTDRSPDRCVCSRFRSRAFGLRVGLATGRRGSGSKSRFSACRLKSRSRPVSRGRYIGVCDSTSVSVVWRRSQFGLRFGFGCFVSSDNSGLHVCSFLAINQPPAELCESTLNIEGSRDCTTPGA